MKSKISTQAKTKENFKGIETSIIAPILLIVFNRPDTTQKVFDAIRQAKPSILYIAADAPRLGNLEDVKNCALVKGIVKAVDWDCKVYYRFAETNQGCGPGPYSAISWVFEHEEEAIILEDDCVPALPFFEYCSQLLERYKNDMRIWLISGNQYNEEAVTSPHSYFFSKYGHSWGWATWKRCWEHVDLEMNKFPLLLEQDLFKSILRTRREANFFRNKYQNIFNDRTSLKHVWDFQCSFAILINGGICIVPVKNLVKNIGYFGTHSDSKSKFHDKPVDENFKILSHPDFILVDVNYDNYHFKHHWRKKAAIYKRIYWKVYQIIKSWWNK